MGTKIWLSLFVCLVLLMGVACVKSPQIGNTSTLVPDNIQVVVTGEISSINYSSTNSAVLFATVIIGNEAWPIKAEDDQNNLKMIQGLLIGHTYTLTLSHCCWGTWDIDNCIDLGVQ